MTKQKIKISLLITVSLIIVIAIILSLVYSMNKNIAKKNLFRAITINDIQTVNVVIDKYPTLVNEKEYVFNFFGDMIGRGNSTPLLTAIQYGNNDIVYLLVENGADVNKSTRCYPVIEALVRGHNKIAWYLIEKGADVSVVDHTSWNRTVPYAIVMHEIPEGDIEQAAEYLELLKFAVENGAPLELLTVRPKGIDSLFGFAAIQNNPLIVKYFIEQRIYDVDARVTDTNKTALICAVESQAYSVCRVLLECGADKDLKDDSGMTAYDYAMELKDDVLIKLFSD